MNDFFNNDSEVAVLSIILKNPDRVYDIDNLKSFMFSSSPNRDLFSEIKILSENNITPEFNLVLNSLIASGKVESVGGKDYLNYLYSLSFDVSNLKEFCKIIVNSYKARTLLSLSSKIPEIVSGNVSSIDYAITSIKNSLDSLSINIGGESTFSLRDASVIAWERIKELVKSDNKISHTSGLKKLDSITGGYNPGDLWIVAGRPGMGKTTFLCNSVLSGVPSLIFSLEMSKELLIYRILSIKTGIPALNIRFGMLNQKELDLIANTLSEIKDLPVFIDSNFFSDIGYVSSTIKKFKKLHNVQIVHLDYIQLLADRTAQSVHELGKISRELKLLSNDLGITSVIYSQLNRLVELREDKRPILSDLRQSGNLEEDPDICVFLYRDIKYHPDTKDKNLLELLVLKHRNGPTGMIPANFDDNTMRITEKD